MPNQTIKAIREKSVEKVFALALFVSIALASVDTMAATWYLTDGNGAATGGVAGGTATIGAATVGGVAAAGASAGVVIATGGAALVVMGAAAA